MKFATWLTAALFCFSLLGFGQKKDSDIEKRVSKLVEKMLNKSSEHKAFSDLEALGCAAVPTIIDKMNDRRKLPDPTISLVNKSSDAFEGLRHYHVERVVDALDAILNQLTGQSFANVESGGPEAEQDLQREKAIRGWREWLRRTPRDKLCK